ncbi:MAG: Fis family transcriptional regulator [Spirochaetales bacterium]|nr:Fis family transcriptional regulator [Spirochaetales bacterium]
MSNILIIDDEPGIRTVLSGILEDEDYSVFTAGDGYEGLSVLKNSPIDLIILDVLLPNMGGIDVLREVRGDYPEIEVIVISGHANIDIAVKAVKLGAFDFVEKPLSMEKIINLVRNALKIEDLRRENQSLRNNLFLEDEMIGTSPAMNIIWERIQQSANSSAKILIHGENGTGKELIAREIHRRSSRSGQPFVEVNCAAIPETLIESELFGHEKGAFTSAVARRKGKFEVANGGTLFLDEIADMSLPTQAKVLRAIQELKFERIGGEKSISVDIRLISATNKNIPDEIRNRTFREDLYFRLNVVPVEVPPLRDRIDDIPLLVDHFLEKFSTHNSGKKKRITAAGMQILQDYSWPGNIRELKNFIERISIMVTSDIISNENVRYYLGESSRDINPQNRLLKGFREMKLNNAKNAFEKMFIEHKLKESDFNISKTAETLGIYPSNLHGKIKKLGIQIEK